MMEKSPYWSRNEPGRARFAEELRRLRRRAPSHWFKALMTALILTGLVVGKQIRKPRKYFASIVIRMQEGMVRTRTDGPVPKNQLRGYIADVSLNRRHVLEMIETFDLYPRLRALDENLALDEFWSDLEIDVFQNRFSLEFNNEEVRRSARVKITYAAPDPQVAIGVVAAIRDVIADFEAARRARAAEVHLEGLRLARDAAAQLIDDRKAVYSRLDAELTIAPPNKAPALEFRIELLRRSINKDIARYELINKARVAAEHKLRIEEERRGLMINVIDQQDPPEHDPRPIRLFILAVVLFWSLWPLSAAGFAAFDSRVYEPKDIGRLGIPVLAHLEKFRGSREQSLRARKKG